MSAKVDNPSEVKTRHRKRVERRAKYLATLTPAQRKVRDDYIAWLRWWKFEYNKLAASIHKNKRFLRTGGRNDLSQLKLTMKLVEHQRLRARTMLLARTMGKIEFQDRLAELEPIQVVVPPTVIVV